jgi:Chitin recognition protein
MHHQHKLHKRVTYSTDGTCGPLNGNTVCDSTSPNYFGTCCSESGWCGNSGDHCGSGCTSGCTRQWVSPNNAGTCGPNYDMSNCDYDAGSFGTCCSAGGWCGSTPAHCLIENGCQWGCTDGSTTSSTSHSTSSIKTATSSSKKSASTTTNKQKTTSSSSKKPTATVNAWTVNTMNSFRGSGRTQPNPVSVTFSISNATGAATGSTPAMCSLSWTDSTKYPTSYVMCGSSGFAAKFPAGGYSGVYNFTVVIRENAASYVSSHCLVNGFVAHYSNRSGKKTIYGKQALYCLASTGCHYNVGGSGVSNAGWDTPFQIPISGATKI